MSEWRCYLVTVYDKSGNQLLCCALKTKSDVELQYYNEPDVKPVLYKMLPLHVKECGPVVAVKRIFEVEISE